MKLTIHNILAILIAVAILGGCAFGTLGNGKVDTIEAAVFKLAVGAALENNPELVAPAAAVSGALLQVMTDESAVDLDTIDAVIGNRLAELNLTASVQSSFTDLVTDIRDRIIDRVRESDGTAAQVVIVVRDLVQIVNDVATARLTG